MKKTLIIILNVDDFSNGRKIVEHIENTTFEKEEDILKAIEGENSEPIDCGSVTLLNLSDFMDMCNNQDLELESVWVGYVHIS